MVAQSNRYKQKKHKLLAVFAIVCLMTLTFGTSVMAANTSDTYFTVTWSYSSPSYQIIQNETNTNYNHHVYRQKTDSSKVFFKITGSSSVSYACVKVCGVPSSCISSSGYGSFTKSDTVNLTYNPSAGAIAGAAKCDVSKNYSISSLVYERSYTYCTLQVKSNLGYGTGYGYWSPDSTGTYNTPTYVSG